MLFPSLRTQKLTPEHQRPNKQRLANICIVKSILEASSRGQLSQAVSSLDILVIKGIRLPSRILGRLLQQCAETKSLRDGKLVHLHLKLTGLKRPTTFLANHLICMYFRCGHHIEARKVFDKMEVRNLYSWNNMLSGYVKLGMISQARRWFDKMPERDYISWNTMVIGYAQNGIFDEALDFYRQLRRLSIGYNEFSFAGVLTACVKLKEFELSRQIHGQVLVAGFSPNVVISSSLLDAYVKCGKVEDARRLFDEMPFKDVFVWTTLVSGYANWGNMNSAVELFNQMPEKNSISWTSLIGGYAKLGLGHEALEVFRKMITHHVKPDQFTYSSCLSACSITASFKQGKQIHAHLIRNNIRINNILVSAIIDMYSKCGSMENAKKIFHVMGDKQDVVIWNTMIAALAHHGHGIEAILLLKELLRSGVKPNRITFVVILNACSHSGLVQEGIELFNSMNRDHRVALDEEHYACLIDLLGRAGRFNELMKYLQMMDCKPGDHVLNALLGVCRIHGNIDIGREAAEHLIELEPKSSGAYVMLSSAYAALGKWELVEKVRQLMDERQVKKELAISWIEIDNKVHAFTVSDASHPLKETIYSVLGHLGNQMEDNVLLPKKIPL
ncbi:pentatricopeptide repeat-containing protein At2g21090 [Neltuma alba]|uniref:pentatricopeptide repeat-containing protein At2g21090 n=1 Tax=Neltuma alba TaxID=207710 RepID=UPI0010A3CF42|nr:pentatricopeptide repeat-containing protein At2g21090 [Prosopis alba]XP_028768674.1 pentatricopeptide repeat-containing protein At2g21090 [Prosopis alba]XP_028768675.1 pentatricopeptide repeat-containing protein At2g21090 [Prosopis alba]XP_028768676.1 pentatricopeptide repeat-containing protein At2g21090 [Prosopis alba]